MSANNNRYDDINESPPNLAISESGVSTNTKKA